MEYFKLTEQILLLPLWVQHLEFMKLVCFMHVVLSWMPYSSSIGNYFCKIVYVTLLVG